MQLKLLGLVSLLAGIAISASSNTYDAQKPFGAFRNEFQKLKKALKKADIIDGVVDDFDPKCHIVPSYIDGKKERAVALGNRFKEAITEEQPRIKISCNGLPDTGLTVALTDPDAPSHENPEWSEMCHWISIIHSSPDVNSNIQTLDITTTGSDMVDLVEYKAPGPPPKTGYHRYVFLLLSGDNTNLTAPAERKHWGTDKTKHGVRDWAAKEGLTVIGANWFVEKNKKQ